MNLITSKILKSSIWFYVVAKTLRERLLRECNPPLSKAIGAGQAAEETCQHAFQILRFQPTSDMDKIIKKETE